MEKIKIAFWGIIVTLFLYFISMLTYTFVEPKAYDFMMKYVTAESLPFDKNKNVYGHDDIVLITIDRSSINKYRWPWKRDLYSKILKYLSEYAQPKVVIFDAILVVLDKDAPQEDKRYFETIKKMDNLIEGFMYNNIYYEDPQKGAEYDKFFTDKYGIKNVKENIQLPQIFPSIIVSPQEFLDSLNHIGSITVIPGFINGNDSDKTIRVQSYYMNYNGAILPSISFSAFLNINNYPDMVIDEKYISFPQMDYKIQHKISSYYPRSIVPIKYYKIQNDYSHKSYSAVDIIDSYDNLKQGKKPIISPEIFKDKIIVLGVNDPLQDGLNDNKSSPMLVNHPAMDIQATCVDNLVHKDFMKVLPNWVNVFITIISMLFIYYVIRAYRIVLALNYSFAIILLIFASACCCFYYCVIVNVITPIVMCFVTMIIAYIHQYLLESKSKEKVESAMGKYMSEDVMKRVIQNIDNLGLGGKKSVATVLFSDIRGFTSMSEKMSAQEVSQLLNEYFSAMEPIVTKYNGIINKFIGDAIMAVFGEPIQDEKHPLNAVKCGFEMLKKVQELNEKWQEDNKPTIQIGVGINTGEVFVGNIGSEKRMEYTVIGDSVNLASRLEGYNKTYKTHILISQSTFEASQNEIKVNKISDVEIRGKSNKMDIYEVVDVNL